MSSNKFRGEIPPDLGDARQLQYLNISENKGLLYFYLVLFLMIVSSRQ
uniref:Uncharacterized protein n=1 Tax=Rhizophora mucronata TaxID=61149 RepID=A0A2P2PSC6_RHIMU